jgi:enoyl-CoA hydratase
MYNSILSEQKGLITYITINRPAQMNALNAETISELNTALKTANDDQNCGVVILTGAGEKAFVAGADIKEFANYEEEEGKKMAGHGQTILFDFVENMSKPVIAAINGFALGGGLELAMSAHIRVASSNARLGLPEVSLGVIPGYGGTQRLAQLVGRGKAMEMIFTAGMISADEAKDLGLVNHVVALEELMVTAEKIAGKILNNSGSAIAAAIKAVNANYIDGINGFEAEIQAFGSCFGSKDFIIGTTAFLAKEKPKFRG